MFKQWTIDTEICSDWDTVIQRLRVTNIACEPKRITRLGISKPHTDSYWEDDFTSLQQALEYMITHEKTWLSFGFEVLFENAAAVDLHSIKTA